MTRNRKVLVVEDNADVRHFIRVILEREGCVVVEADNADEGFDLFVDHCPSLLISDIMLDEGEDEGKDGLDMNERIRDWAKRMEFQYISVAITGFDRLEGQAPDLATAASSFDYHLQKPFTADALREIVRQELGEMVGA